MTDDGFTLDEALDIAAMVTQAIGAQGPISMEVEGDKLLVTCSKAEPFTIQNITVNVAVKP